ncbi:MAG: N-6 DNA methylase [Candidatus Hodarchaeales archaeon]|jgi:tRNA1(Val) A37 N6-methylase TrmN6
MVKKIDTNSVNIKAMFDSIVASMPVDFVGFLDAGEMEELTIFSEMTSIPIESSMIFRSLSALLILNRLRFIALHEDFSNFSDLSIKEISSIITNKHPRLFQHSILESIANQSDLISSHILVVLKGEISENFEDIISSLYLQILEQSVRRKLGQFWTPEHVSNFMVELLLEKKPKNVLDPCSGPGTFIKSLKKVTTEFSGRVTGIEIHPLLFEILNVNFYGSSIELETIKSDFLKINVNDLKNSIEGNLAVRNTKSIGTFFQTNSSTKGFESIICNPPYSRHHVLSPEIKEEIGKEIEETFGGKFSRISSLFMYFILKSLKILTTNGTMVVITPTIIFESKNSSYLKKILKERFTIPLIIVFHHSLNLFPEVDTAACIFEVEGKRPRDTDVSKLVIVKKWTSKEEILDNIRKNTTEGFVWKNGEIHIKKQADLDHESNWTSPRTFSDKVKSNKLTELSNYFTAMRGIATGNNKYFTFTNEELDKYSIKPEHVIPTITKNRYVQKYLLTNEDFKLLKEENRKTWLLYVQNKIENINDQYLLAYLDRGLILKVHEGSLVKTRKHWHVIERRKIPTFFFTYLSRGNPRFILNEARVRPLNVFLLIYPKDENKYSSEITKLFWVILNSNFTFNSLRDVGRCYGGDTLKVEPKEMGKTLILDPFKISIGSKNALLILADKLREIYTSNNKEVLAEIDEVINKELTSKDS